MLTLTQYKRRKGGIKSGLTRITKDIDSFLVDADSVVIEAKLESVLRQLSEFNVCRREMETLYETDEEYFGEVEADMLYMEGLDQIVVKLRSQLTPTVSTPAAVNRNTGIRLPKITLPSFDSDPTLWMGFWDMFHCSVHINKELSDIQKFTYLRGQLSGEAKQLIEGFAIEGASYNTAVALLQKTYGHRDRIKSAHITNLTTLKPPSYNIEELKGFYASFESTLRSIETLQITLHEASVVILMNKVPSPLKETLRRALGDDGLDLEKFIQAYQTEVFNLESVSAPATSHMPVASASFALQESSVRRKGCRLCEGGHVWFKCLRYKTSVSKVKRAKQLNLCTGCLSSDHGSKGCVNPNVRDCKFCSNKHYHILCQSRSQWEDKRRDQKPQQVTKAKTTTTTMSVSSKKTSIILPTVMLPAVKEPRGILKMRALLDQCSQRTFVLKSALESLRHNKIGEEELELRGFTGACDSKKYPVVAFEYKFRGRNYPIKAVVVETLPEHKGSECLDTDIRVLRNKGYKLADPQITRTSRLDLLVGADFYYDLVRPGYKKEGDIILLPTKFGYALSGSCYNDRSSAQVEVVTILKVAVAPMDQIISSASCNPCHDDLKCLWELDHLGISPIEDSKENKTALDIYQETVSYSATSQQYEVRLPWNHYKEKLPSNYGLAAGRLRGLQKRFLQDQEYCGHYSKVLADQLRRGFIEEVPFGVTDACHYLAHHGVTKNSVTTPVRIVYDCSASVGRGLPSLNDCLFTGPSLVPDLAKVLLRFRVQEYAWVSDIEKAFLMLKLYEGDRDYTRFLWPKDPLDINSALLCYRFKVVLFGATCSQFLLNATVLKHLSIVDEDPKVVEAIKDGLYIDNLQGTGSDEETVIQGYWDAQRIMSQAHLFLREWATNSPQLKDLLELDGVAATNQERVKTLGLVWLPDDDSLTFNATPPPCSRFTKRECLRSSAQLFDPLGVLLPVTIRSRIFLQQLWRLKLDWDDPLPEDCTAEWSLISKDLKLCSDFCYPRRAVCADSVEVHAFSDASGVAYGTAIYFVSPEHSRLVIAKCKVAPIRSITIPRLELTAALLAARLLKFVEDAYQNIVKVSKIVLWCDSQVTLHWLRSMKKLPVYVANRVDEIKALIPTVEFRYVSSKDNPSDLLSRGVTAKHLKSSAFWWEGPKWLRHEDEWPEDIVKDEPTPLITSQVIEAKDKQDTQLWNWEKYGSYNKLIRVVAWTIRYINNLKAKVKGTQPTECTLLNINELKAAEKIVAQRCQQECFPEEYEMLSGDKGTRNNLINQLGLVIKGGVIVCEGRLKLAALPDPMKYPILIPSKHPFTTLLIQMCHRVCCHYGINYVVAFIRQRWWIPKIRQAVKQVTSKCITCRKMQGTTYAAARVPPLPDIRITPRDPFEVTGVDYTGAIPVRDSHNNKAYMLLFTCATTRAIHLEVVSNMTCESFLHAFRRFCSRQGYPQIMMSDNATTFVGASRHLEDIQCDPRLQAHLTELRCEWRFIPARAPWFGAIWERAIGIVKAGLKKVLGRALVTLEELTTILLELEATVNDRPLTYVSGDLEDPSPVTPSMLVRGRRLRDFPKDLVQLDEQQDPSYGSKAAMHSRYNYINKLIRDLWKRWSNEYLASLREAYKTKKGSSNKAWPSLNDIVLVHDEGPRVLWKLGRVVKLYPGRDDLVRVVQIKTKSGLTTRPNVKLYPLEQDVETDPIPRPAVTDDDGDGVGSPDHTPQSSAVAGPSAGHDPVRTLPLRRAAVSSSQLWRSNIAAGLL